MRNASAYGGAARGRPVAAWLVLALAAAPAAAVPAAAQQCVLQMGTQSMPFNQCTTINDIGDDFRLFWNSSAANAASVTWGMSTAGKSGYVSFAFPESPGDMVGAYAFSLQSCSSCPTGESMQGCPALRWGRRAACAGSPAALKTRKPHPLDRPISCPLCSHQVPCPLLQAPSFASTT